MGTTIKIDEAIFNNTCAEVDQRRENYEEKGKTVKRNLDKAAELDNWENMNYEIFEIGSATMNSIQDKCMRNLYFLSNVLQQVKLEFEAADRAGTGTP